LVRLDGEELMHSGGAAVETDLGTGEVQPPHPKAFETDQALGLVPLCLESLSPMTQRERVVLAKILIVANLEPGALELKTEKPRLLQFTVREDERVDKGAAGDPPS